MAAPNLNLRDGFAPCFRGEEEFQIGDDDVTFPQPRAVQALTTGNLVFVDSLGVEHTRTNMAAGDNVDGIGGGLLAVKTVRGSSTVTSVRTNIW